MVANRSTQGSARNNLVEHSGAGVQCLAAQHAAKAQRDSCAVGKPVRIAVFDELDPLLNDLLGTGKS